MSNADYSVLDAFDVFEQIGHERSVLLRHRVADRIGYVDRRRTGPDCCAKDTNEEVPVRTRRVFRRKLDIRAIFLSAPHRFGRRFDGLVVRDAQLVLEMQVRRRKERMDARRFSMPERLPSCVDVAGRRSRKGSNGGTFDRLCDFRDALYDDRRRCGEARFNHVDLRLGEHLRDPKSCGRSHRRTRRLFAVAQGRVEYDHAVHGRAAPVETKNPSPPGRRACEGKRR